MKKPVIILLTLLALALSTSTCSKESTSPGEELLPPTDLSMTLIENNKIQIQWTDNSTKEEKFIINRKKGTYDWQNNYSQEAANITSFTDIIPTDSDTVYAYTIRAFDGENYSEFSDTIAWFSKDTAPTGLDIEQIAQDSLLLIWKDNSIGEQYFRIDRKIDEKGWQINHAQVTADSTTYIDYTQSLYDTCNYRIYAVNGITHSEYTENEFIPFLPAPTNLELQPLTATQVRISWNDNCHNEEGYKVFYKRGDNAQWDSLNLAENTEEYTDEEVLPGVVNYYKICAYYKNDNSGYVEADVNTLPAVSNLSCEQQNVHTFLLNWEDNSEFEQGFKIDRKIDNNEWSNDLFTTGKDVNNFVDSTLGRNYETVYYRVFAFYENFLSDTVETNNEINFPAPTNLDFCLDGNEIILNWQYSLTGINNFVIARKIESNSWDNNYAEVGPEVFEWSETIDPTLKYSYRLRAKYINYYSDYSNIISYQNYNEYNHIKLFRDNLPWSSNAMIEVFDSLGFTEGYGDNTYEIVSSNDFSNIELIPGYDLVIISSDQSQNFYDNYAQNQVRIQYFVEMGGGLLWEACDEGWAGGSMEDAGIILPGEVETTLDYHYLNYVTDQNLPIVSGLPDTMDHNYASHEGLSNLPDNAIIYCINGDNEPTLIEYNFGFGTIIVTGQPLEHQYDYIYGSEDMEELLPRIVSYLTNNGIRKSNFRDPKSIAKRKSGK